MKKDNAFTLVEMMITLVITTFLILAIVTSVNIGNRYYGKLCQETGIYNDIAYGLKLIANRVHTAQVFSISTGTSPWSGQCLVVGNEKFGVYNSGASIDFVYLPNKNDESKREVILSVALNESLNLNFTDADYPTLKGSAVKIKVSGTKYNIPFNFSETATRRVI